MIATLPEQRVFYQVNGGKQRVATRGLVASDVDGVLTNGTVIYNDNGSRSRAFSVIDGHGVQLLEENGFDVVFISGENDKNIRLRCRKLGVDFIHCAGVDTKHEALSRYAYKKFFGFPELYVIGDDVNDLSLINMSIYSAAPNGSVIHRKFEDRVKLILESRGGDGAFREFAEAILESNGINPY